MRTHKPTFWSKVGVTIGVIIAFHLGSSLAVPGVTPSTAKLLGGAITHNNALQNFSLLTGGGLDKISLLALGISPYITAQIIVQLAGRIFPKLASGRANDIGASKRTSLTSRWLTLPIAIAQGLGFSEYFHAIHVLSNIWEIGLFWGLGSIVCMWLADIIDNYGVGSGPALLILLGILGTIPQAIINSYHTSSHIFVIASLLFVALIVGTILTLEKLLLKIDVFYPKNTSPRVTSKSYFPIKFTQGGVMPAIFASMFLSIPPSLASIGIFHGKVASWLSNNLSSTTYAGTTIITGLLIIAFGWLFAITSFDADDFAVALGREGGFMRGKRVGADTANFIEHLYRKISWIGTILLAFLTTLPAFLIEARFLVNLNIPAITILLLASVLADQATRWQGAWRIQKQSQGGWLAPVLKKNLIPESLAS
jgi:preprotein translocase subunit SecY